MTNLYEIMKKVEGRKIVNLAELKTINKETIELGYNRKIDMHLFSQNLKKAMYEGKGKFGYWNGMKTNVTLVPLMEHNHKNGVECEPHLRCLVDGLCHQTVVDMSYSTFNELTDVTEYLKKVA